MSRLRWINAESVREARRILESLGHVEVQLPPDFHHTLFVRFFPNARPGQAEQLDVRDGAGIIDKVSEIRGLEDLHGLSELAKHYHARVQLVSPVPLIIVSLPQGEERPTLH